MKASIITQIITLEATRESIATELVESVTCLNDRTLWDTLRATSAEITRLRAKLETAK